MRGGRLTAYVRRLRRIERREAKEFRRWLEDTDNLLHVSVLLFVPLLIGIVTYLSNTLPQISFLLFPPLAAGTYQLFANPEGRYSSPIRFVGGLTLGAFSGWLAFEVASRFVYGVPRGTLQVHAGAAALAVLLTAAVTWGFDFEEPAAFSTALLVLLAETDTVTTLVGIDLSGKLTFLINIAFSSTIIAIVFVVWRHEFYEQRADFLYQTTQRDDHVIVPMRGEGSDTVARFGAQLAAAHDAGKVVLMQTVETALEEPALADGVSTAAELDPSTPAADVVDRLERRAAEIETRVGVPCEVLVAGQGSSESRTVIQAAESTGCDLIVTPYEEERGRLSAFVRGLFASEYDVVVVRANSGRTRWRRIMVAVRRPGDVAHAMLDFAQRLAGRSGQVSVCHCIDTERERRRAEGMLADLAETFERAFETRVANERIEEFLGDTAGHYDLTIIGSSTDRSAASRFISPPTFQRLQDVESDIAIVHRG